MDEARRHPPLCSDASHHVIPSKAEGYPVDALGTVLYSDENHALAEIEVSRASEHVDLEALRQNEAFEEGREAASA